MTTSKHTRRVYGPDFFLRMHQRHVDRVKELHGDSIIVVGAYSKAKEKLHHRCTVCDTDLYLTPHSVNQKGTGCWNCRNSRPFSDRDYRKRLTRAHAGQIELIGEFFGTQKKAKHKCSCGHVWSPVPAKIINNRRRHGKPGGCPICSYKKDRSMDASQFDEKLAKKHDSNVERVGPYTARKQRVHVICNACGHEWHSIASSLLDGHGCVKCATRSSAKRLSLTNEQYDQKIRSTGIKRIEDYVNNHTKILHAHEKCGHQWDVVPMSILSGSGCPECVTHGGYDQTKPGTLYYLSACHEGRKIYKIGITNHTVAKRFKKYNLERLGVKTLFQYGGTGADILAVETHIKKTYKRYATKDPVLLMGPKNGAYEWFDRDVLLAEKRGPTAIIDELVKRGTLTKQGNGRPSIAA